MSPEEIIQAMAVPQNEPDAKTDGRTTEPMTNNYETEDQTMEEEPNQASPSEHDTTEEEDEHAAEASRTPTSDYVMDEVAQTSKEEALPPKSEPKNHTEQGTENSHVSEVTQ
jgi:hypothetical protein